MNQVIIKYFDLDLVIVFIVFLMAFSSETGAGIFAFGQGLVMDIFSGGILGLFTLLYLIVFLGVKLASRPLDLLSTGGQIAIISMAVLFKELMMVTLLHLFSLEITSSFANFALFVLSAVCSGLIAPFIFYLMNYSSDLIFGDG